MREIFQASVKTVGGSAITLLFGFINVKLLALILGPDGLGAYSIIKQLVVFAGTIFITGGQTALVHGLSSRAGAGYERYLRSSASAFLLTAVVIFLLISLSAPWLGQQILPGRAHSGWIVVTAASAVFFYAASAFLFGILNAAHRLGRLAVASASNAVALALLSYPAAQMAKAAFTEALALLLVLAQVPPVLLAIVFCGRELLAPLHQTWAPEKTDLQHLRNMSFSTVFAAAMQAAVLLLVRTSIANSRGLPDAGYFDVAWTISMVNAMIVLQSFATYYMPALTRTRTALERDRLVTNVLFFSLVAIVPLLCALMVGRSTAIHLLYSKDFSPSIYIMRWMSIGDFFKVSSFLFAMPMLAFIRLKAWLIFETCWNAGLAAVTFVTLHFGQPLEWIGAGFLALYAVYMVAAFVYGRQEFAIRLPKALGVLWVAGLSVTLIVARITWTSTILEPIHFVVAILFCGGYLVVAELVRRRLQTSPTGSLSQAVPASEGTSAS